MLRNIIRNIPLNKNILYKRCNVPQVMLNVRHKQNTASQHMTVETDDDIENTQPIIYSKSKAANMRIDEYRIRDDNIPSYQPMVVALSLAVFLVYFCILREENDIDDLIYVDLETSFKRCETEYNKKKNV